MSLVLTKGTKIRRNKSSKGWCWSIHLNVDCRSVSRCSINPTFNKWKNLKNSESRYISNPSGSCKTRITTKAPDTLQNMWKTLEWTDLMDHHESWDSPSVLSWWITRLHLMKANRENKDTSEPTLCSLQNFIIWQYKRLSSKYRDFIILPSMFYITFTRW